METQNPKPESVVVDLQEAAALMGCSKATARRRCEAGHFDYFVEGKVYIRKASIMEWIESRLQDNQPTAA